MTMYRGRYQLGQEVVLGLVTLESTSLPDVPDYPVHVRIWSGGTKVLGKFIPIHDRYGTTAFFQYRQFIGAQFSAGTYHVNYHYVGSDGHGGIETDHFEVVAGGHADGTIIAMNYYNRPHADFVVTHLDSGKIQQRRNPSV